jgi:hypothetical protein
MVSAFTFAVERSSESGRPVNAARRFFTTCSDQVPLIIGCVVNVYKGDLPNSISCIVEDAIRCYSRGISQSYRGLLSEARDARSGRGNPGIQGFQGLMGSRWRTEGVRMLSPEDN